MLAEISFLSDPATYWERLAGDFSWEKEKQAYFLAAVGPLGNEDVTLTHMLFILVIYLTNIYIADMCARHYRTLHISTHLS